MKTSIIFTLLLVFCGELFPNNQRFNTMHHECKVNDPFIGTFTMSYNGQTAGQVTISLMAPNQYKIDMGNGYDIATKNGNALEGNSQGTPFRITASDNDLVMDLMGARFTLTRIGGGNQSGMSTVQNHENMGDDLFVGTYTASVNGQAGGSITISSVGGNSYRLENSGGTDQAIRNGNALEGNSQGTPFRIVASGNNLAMELSGYRIDLIRASSNGGAGGNGQTPTSGSIDPRLVGTWRKSTAHNNGNAGISSNTVVMFMENGTMQMQQSTATGGGGWSGGSSSDPVQTGSYSVLGTNREGGTLLINGGQVGYFFSNFMGEQKLAFDGEKGAFLKIR